MHTLQLRALEKMYVLIVINICDWVFIVVVFLLCVFVCGRGNYSPLRLVIAWITLFDSTVSDVPSPLNIW